MDVTEGSMQDETLLKALFFINSVSATRQGRGQTVQPALGVVKEEFISIDL